MVLVQASRAMLGKFLASFQNLFYILRVCFEMFLAQHVLKTGSGETGHKWKP